MLGRKHRENSESLPLRRHRTFLPLSSRDETEANLHQLGNTEQYVRTFRAILSQFRRSLLHLCNGPWRGLLEATNWSKGCARVRSGQETTAKVRCHGTLNFPPWLLTVARGSYGLEGATNRRSCAADADNYLCYHPIVPRNASLYRLELLDLVWLQGSFPRAPVGPETSSYAAASRSVCMRTRRRIRICWYFKAVAPGGREEIS